MKYKLNLADAAATEKLAGRLQKALPGAPGGWIVLLQGELGSGKSTLARAMIRAYGHTGSVPSPTYTLVEPYTLGDVTIYHLDLYRVGDVEELEFLGWSDLEEGLRLIEWPERVPGLAEVSDIGIGLAYAADGRDAEIIAYSERGEAVVQALIDGDA